MDEKKLPLYILIVVALANFSTAFTGSSVSIALTSIGKFFSAAVPISGVVQNWVATSYLLSTAIFAVPFAKVAEKIGLKKLFDYGLLIFIISSILSALAPTIEFLIFFRILTGIGGAMLYTTGLTIITRALPPEKRGQGIGISISSVYIGLSLAPVISGFLTQNIGWQSIFIFLIPFTILALIISRLYIKSEWLTENMGKFDFKGSLLYAFGILLFLYGFTIIKQTMGVILCVIGVILLVVFTWWELRVKEPVFEMKLFKNKTFTFSSLAALVSYMATFAITYVLSYHLQYIDGFSPQLAGILLVVQPVMMACVAPIAGRLSDRIIPQRLAALGMSLISIGMVLLIFLSADTPIWYIICASFIIGIGVGLFSSPNTNAIMSSVHYKYASAASATVSTMRVIGQTFSIGIFTVLITLFMGFLPFVEKYYPLLMKSSRVMCIICAVFCILSIAFSLFGSNEAQKNRNSH